MSISVDHTCWCDCIQDERIGCALFTVWNHFQDNLVPLSFQRTNNNGLIPEFFSADECFVNFYRTL
jgi:hypothetical protein